MGALRCSSFGVCCTHLQDVVVLLASCFCLSSTGSCTIYVLPLQLFPLAPAFLRLLAGTANVRCGSVPCACSDPCFSLWHQQVGAAVAVARAEGAVFM